MEIWQAGFSDHRIRDAEDYNLYVNYICRNPVGRKLVERATDYPYCSAFPGRLKDEVPQWLKPLAERRLDGAAKAAPLQNQATLGAPKGAPLQNGKPVGKAKATPIEQGAAFRRA